MIVRRTLRFTLAVVFLYLTCGFPGAQDFSGNQRALLASPPPALPITVVSSLPGSPADAWYAAQFDAKRGYVYFGAASHSASIVRICASNWQVVSTLPLGPAGGTSLTGSAIDEEGGFAYYAVSEGGTARVLKVSLDNFTVVDSLLVSSDSALGRGVVLDPQHGYAYIGYTQVFPARISRIRLSDFSLAGSIQLNLNEQGINSAVIDPAGDHAYFAAGTGAVRIRLSDFTRDGFVNWDATGDSHNVYTGVADPAGGFVYFSVCNSSPSAPIVKISIPSFQVVASMPLPTNVSPMYFSAIDQLKRIAYFSTGRGEHLIGVDLQTFTSIGETDVPGGGQLACPGAFDQKTGCAYLGQLAGADGMVKLFLDGPPTAPPLNVQAAAPGTDRVTWTWTDQSSGRAWFDLWADATAGSPTTLRAASGAGVTSCTTTGFTPNTQVVCQVAAVNPAGTGPRSSPVSVWTLANTPQAPQVTNRAETSLIVTLSASDGNPAGTQYAIGLALDGGGQTWLRADGSQGAAPVWQTATAWGSCTVTGLSVDGNYRLSARARNQAGIETGDSIATVSTGWSPPPKSAGAALWRYYL